MLAAVLVAKVGRASGFSPVAGSHIAFEFLKPFEAVAKWCDSWSASRASQRSLTKGHSAPRASPQSYSLACRLVPDEQYQAVTAATLAR